MVLSGLVVYSGWAIDKYFTKSFNNTTELAGFLETEPHAK
jgi:hypothetical protein